MNPRGKSKISRRKFLLNSALLTTYSLWVKAPPLRAEDAPLPDHNSIQKTLQALAAKPGVTGQFAAEPTMSVVDLSGDFMVAGGGMAGVCAALAAARNGCRVILVQDRSRLGGNASSEVRMHIVGADQHGSRKGWREGGLIEEFRIEDAVHNPHRAYELWDLMLYDKIVSEPNIRLILDTSVFKVEMQDGKIARAFARCDKTETIYRITAPFYADCTGDSRLALEAGASYRWGRESKDEFGEPLAMDKKDEFTMGSSILFTARKHDKAMPYRPPAWARKITRHDLRWRPVGKSYEYGYWWIELGGANHTIRDNERIRFELLAVVLGVWDHIKNSGDCPDSANWALQTVGMIPGKREARRVIGDYTLTQDDLERGWRENPDGVCIGGWPFDDHPPGGFNAPELAPYRSVPLKEPYNIAFGSLFSKDIANLLLAGRNISVTHVALSSTRVMATCSVIGQAAGTAAAQCAREKITPRQLRNTPDALKRLQQRLLRDDQSIRELRNEDPDDHARRATVTASAEAKGKAANVINGLVRDIPGQWDNRWGTPLDKDTWIQLAWPKPATIREVQLTFDTGFERQLTLSASDSVTKTMIRAPQPETVKDYAIELLDEKSQVIRAIKVESNYQRLRRHTFEPAAVSAVKLRVQSTHGSPEARLYEIRCYS